MNEWIIRGLEEGAQIGIAVIDQTIQMIAEEYRGGQTPKRC